MTMALETLRKVKVAKEVMIVLVRRDEAEAMTKTKDVIT